ncbi:MAG: NUDIX domain-containing protein [Rhodoblastus sp.]|nr:MAG: NUDIX domain-containing protein [Rhodoblastus sp.]
MNDTSGAHPRLRDMRVETLSAQWGRLTRTSFDYRHRDGVWRRLVRESYGRGDGATVLPCDPARGMVILIRQFRLPALREGADGFIWEAPAGLLDEADPAARVAMEAEEETGFRVRDLVKVCEAYSSPGSFLEKMHYFIGRYGAQDRIGSGGGLAEGEDIEVVERRFARAYAMIGAGEIVDAKTIILLQHAKLTVFA